MNAADDWRENWFVKNIGTEIPFIGPFLKENETSKAVREAIKTAFMLAGGLTFMMTDPFDSMAMDQSPALSGTKMAGGMALGMMAGNVTYNVLESSGDAVYRCATAFRAKAGEGGYKDLEIAGGLHAGGKA